MRARHVWAEGMVVRARREFVEPEVRAQCMLAMRYFKTALCVCLLCCGLSILGLCLLRLVLCNLLPSFHVLSGWQRWRVHLRRVRCFVANISSVRNWEPRALTVPIIRPNLDDLGYATLRERRGADCAVG